MPDLVAIGDCNPDLVLSGDVEPAFGQAEKLLDAAQLTIGGSAAIVAAGTARLGASTALVATVGEDSLGRAQLAALHERGVEVGAVRELSGLTTGISVILSRGDDRAILTALGAIAELEPGMIDRGLLLAARHVHFSSYFLMRALQPQLAALAAELREAGVGVSLDTNWDPAGEWGRAGELVEEVLPHVDVLFPNLNEARMLSGEREPEAAAAKLAERVGLAVVKLGPKGAIAAAGGASAAARPPAVEVCDTTGAGDSFVAGFLAARLRGLGLERCLELGCACGALSARGLGGTERQPTFAQARAAVEGAPAFPGER